MFPPHRCTTVRWLWHTGRISCTHIEPSTQPGVYDAYVVLLNRRIDYLLISASFYNSTSKVCHLGVMFGSNLSFAAWSSITVTQPCCLTTHTQQEKWPPNPYDLHWFHWVSCSCMFILDSALCWKNIFNSWIYTFPIFLFFNFKVVVIPLTVSHKYSVLVSSNASLTWTWVRYSNPRRVSIGAPFHQVEIFCYFCNQNSAWHFQHLWKLEFKIKFCGFE